MWVRACTHAPLPPDNQIPGALLPEVMDTKPPKLLQEFDRACSHNLTQQPSPLLSSPLRSPLWAHEEQRGSCRWQYKLPTRYNMKAAQWWSHGKVREVTVGWVFLKKRSGGIQSEIIALVERSLSDYVFKTCFPCLISEQGNSFSIHWSQLLIDFCLRAL